MERLVWLMVLVVTVVGCGGGLPVGSEATTTSSNTSTPSTGTVFETTHPQSSSSSMVATTKDSFSITTTITTNMETTTTSSPSTDHDPALQSLIDMAMADLAARLDVPPGDIGVVSAEAVVWPDGALGCPQPGMVYTQVQVEGARIVLSHGGVAYAYHSGGSRSPFLCDKA